MNEDTLNKCEARVNAPTMSDKIDLLSAALAIAQSEMGNAKKDTTNPFFKSKYADLASVWDTIRPVLGKNGLSVVQTTDSESDQVVVVHTMLLHKSGQWLRGSLKMKPSKSDPQGLGSTITYARRYALAAMVGVAQEDDDANSGSVKASTPEAVVKFINKDQVEEIKELIEETGSDITRFCDAFNISKVSDMKSTDYRQAVTTLNRKKKVKKTAAEKYYDELPPFNEKEGGE